MKDTAVRLCGSMSVHLAGRRLEGVLPNRQGRLVFAYLVLNRERMVSRAELLQAVWSDLPPAAPDAALSSVVSRLRSALPAGSIEGRRELRLRLGLDPWIDVEVATAAPLLAEQALDAGRVGEALDIVRSALEILRPGLMPGMDRPWVDERRDALRDLEVALLETEARAGLTVGGAELVAAERAAREAVKREPFRESAHAVLMQALAARGNVAEALRAYEHVRVLLREQLGTVPSADLRDLSDRLLREPPGTGVVRVMTGPPTRGVPALVGRDQECGRIAALLAAAQRQRSGALVVTGDPGIGKSALCSWAAAHATGMRVLSIRGVESEVDLPFAGLAELCAGEADRIARLPDPQARALQAALAQRDETPGDRFATGAALLSLLGVAAEDEPLLVVVDDAQWLDAASADALLFAARRLGDDRVALLVATRPDGLFDSPGAGLPRLPLEGLDATASHALLDTAHGELADPVARLLADRAAGNPLALLEVPRMLTREQLSGQDEIDEPLPVGPSLRRALLNRVGGLEDDARRALLVAAASGAERVQPVVEALTALGIDPRVLDRAEDAGALSIAGEQFAFRHPLLRSAVYHGAAGPARRSVHAALAEVTDGESRAWHRAHATVGEDEGVAGSLEAVGHNARRRGAPAAAASALERAAGLSPPGPDRVRRLTEAARNYHIAGRGAAALRLLDAALADSPEAVQRADIQHVRGRILVMQGQMDTAFRLLVDEAERIRDIDADRTATMLAEACLDRVVSADIASTVSVARDAFGVAARGHPRVQAFAGVMLAVALVLSGDRAEGGALLDQFLPSLRLADPLTEAGELVSVAAQCCFWLERYDIASELLDRMTAAAREASAPAALLMPLCCRAELDLRLGRWTIAAAQFEEAADLGDEMSQSVFAAYAPECLARLAAAAGDEARCREHVTHALGLIDQHNNELGRLFVDSAAGLLELGLGRIDQAISHLERARSRAVRARLAEPNVVHWQADLIEAYVRAGDEDAARNELSALERQAERTSGTWALGTAARSRGLLAAHDEFGRHFAEAFVQLDASGDRFEVARTHLCHGERLRRAGRRTDARRALREAVDGFDELGATPWAARALAELSATGANPRRRQPDSDHDQLTAHEVQVAVVVARGASNREAAAALFLSPKTIEFHLAHIYRKLGVRTRTELAGVAARRGWLDDRPPLSQV